MALFQQSVLKKHIETLNNKVIAQKWEKFQAHFLNATIQQNIRKSKEEQYQEGFLRDLFVNIFGYILNPTEHFNLTTELKNITNSKKVDGAIVIDGKAIGVIELKGTDTTDLAKIEAQAFGYKTNQPGCNYVITSNFEKLRFYIDNTTQYQEFNLFTLTKDEFTVLYCCLDWESISNNLPTNLLNQSVSKENAITKQLYNDYSAFKRVLYNNLVELNPQHDKLLLFKKTQKLLDRFLFIFFAEDRLLLPTNLIRRINKEWENLQKMRIPVSLYDRYVMYFHDLNEGAKVTLPAFGKKTGEAIEETHEIFAYNGGLFKNDEFLDNLKINDQLLYEHTHKMSDYDFQSEVDVNILGHIFENSLNEIDEIKSEIEGNVVDKTKTKRKKDGVFYTPKYITKYIVDNTVGKLCTEKKEELQLIEEEYHTEKNLQTKTKKALLDKLSTYREWLLQLTICDPACGSGAFLNQALEFLIEEHTYIDELQAKLMGDSLVLSDVENSILENNLYGVDLNDESIEIAKLSLWLRTAQKGRKLNSLNNNIKCGNSLIDDPEVAGDKAFSWEKEFPEVFAPSSGSGGGFDVIIGNPPYVQSTALSEKDKKYIYLTYKSSEYQINTYGIFIEKSIQILKNNSFYSLIIPNYWISTKYDSILREIVFKSNIVTEIVNLYQVFEDANVDTLILTGIKTVIPNFPKISNIKSISNTSKNIIERLSDLNLKKWEFEDVLKIDNIDTVIQFSFKKELELKTEIALQDYFEGYQGMKPYEMGKGIPQQTREMMQAKIYHSDKKVDDTYFPLIGSGNIQRYFIRPSKEFIKYGNNLAAPRKFEIFSQPRILVNRIFSKERIDASFIETTLINNTDVFNLIPKQKTNINQKYILGILCSKLSARYFKSINVNLDRTAFPKLNVNNLMSLPLPKVKSNDDIEELSLNVENILKLNYEFQSVSNKFSTYFSSQYMLEKRSTKLEKWYELSFVDFIKELNKAIKTAKGTPLTKKDEFEWMELFEDNKKKALELKAEIDKTDKEIDKMVYALYGLTEEEIKIICDATS
jgi:type I restriction-modification system DNA methylase subunit